MLDSQEKEQNEHQSTRSKDVGILKKGLEKWPPRIRIRPKQNSADVESRFFWMDHGATEHHAWKN